MPNTSKNNLKKIIRSAIKAVDPHSSLRRLIAKEGPVITIKNNGHYYEYDLETYKNIWVVGCGKAACPMTHAIDNLLGEKITGGMVVTKYGHTGNIPPVHIEIAEAGHPQPDQNSVKYTQKVYKILEKAGKNDLIIGLISGGGSTLWTFPAKTISLDDLQKTSAVLLESGVEIHEINAIRKHLSRIKGGRAAKIASPADVLVFVISDVIGDDLDVIASGPFAPDKSTFEYSWNVIEKYELQNKIPARVINYLKKGKQTHENETPKENFVFFKNVHHTICSSNRIAIDAAARQAESLGYRTIILDEPIQGEAKEAAKEFCQKAKDIKQQAEAGKFCLVGGGETTVTMGKNHGKGGRNQEFALVAAFELADTEGIALASCGTDGNDGPTDAAGAIVDCQTISRAKKITLNPDDALQNHNAYPFFQNLNDLLITGATNTNVMDIQIALIE